MFAQGSEVFNPLSKNTESFKIFLMFYFVKIITHFGMKINYFVKNKL